MRDRLAFALERVPAFHPLLLRFDGIAPGGRRRYVNRINGHVVVLDVTR